MVKNTRKYRRGAEGNSLIRQEEKGLPDAKHFNGPGKQLVTYEDGSVQTIYVLSDDHLKRFGRFLTRWVKRMGLGEWKIVLFGFSDEGDEDSLATVALILSGRIASVFLNRNWPIKPTSRELERVAMHEVTEILLSGLTDMVDDRLLPPGRLEDVTHQIIRHLETAIFSSEVFLNK